MRYVQWGDSRKNHKRSTHKLDISHYYFLFWSSADRCRKYSLNVSHTADTMTLDGKILKLTSSVFVFQKMNALTLCTTRSVSWWGWDLCTAILVLENRTRVRKGAHLVDTYPMWRYWLLWENKRRWIEREWKWRRWRRKQRRSAWIGMCCAQCLVSRIMTPSDINYLTRPPPARDP